ncbi:MAG: DUF5107 domain-containing protein [Phycisphaerae bacterium]
MSQLILPTAPIGETGPVKAWLEPVAIDTYEPMPAEKNPMFLNRRVYQGSSGRVYPLPFIDRIATKKIPRLWQALHIENEFIRVMILPELGGRIHIGLDKTNNYDFFYRQNVIKPALVGLAGPWASGGVEFNWPQHHRPGTFLPMRFDIEEHANGARTIWLNDRDRLSRLEASHGICLHPASALLELKVRLHNCTLTTQTFLWWANAAARVHERYQSFFPPDVHFVADHARRAMSSFPLCQGHYYGIDYKSRAKHGVPEQEAPPCFKPTGEYPPNDLSWYANIPVPTSYMAIGSKQDFLGGYDHAAKAGFVHIADHHIAPGKKQWTWGNHNFGYAWDRNLTDGDGPYVELMAGVFTDNQPDFSFLHPGEIRQFRQYWYPIQQIGPAQAANISAAVSLKVADGRVQLGVAVTAVQPNCRITLIAGDRKLWQSKNTLAPNRPLLHSLELPSGTSPAALSLRVEDSAGTLLISYENSDAYAGNRPTPAVEPPLPAAITSTDELYITGLHLDQYRHATRDPEPYWQEIIRRDPGDCRANNALGLRLLRRGLFLAATECFRKAVARLTQRNANPRDAEPLYNLGIALQYQNDYAGAYDAFAKATWSHAWADAASMRLAELDCRSKDYPKAIERLTSRGLHQHNPQAAAMYALSQAACNNSSKSPMQQTQADAFYRPAFDDLLKLLGGGTIGCDTFTAMDIAHMISRSGFLMVACKLLEQTVSHAAPGALPMLHYHLARLYDARAMPRERRKHLKLAQKSVTDYCFPWLLEDLVTLQWAIGQDVRDCRAHYYLGNFLYAHDRGAQAMVHWKTAANLDPTNSIAWRNLGIAKFNVGGQPQQALKAFNRAIQAAPRDARLVYERDQLWKRLGYPPAKRMAKLLQHNELVHQRDDLCIELAALHNSIGQPREALTILTTRHFQPWEGGEGLALGEYVRSRQLLAQDCLQSGDAPQAVTHLDAALNPPENLGEARHLLANHSDIFYAMGCAQQSCGNPAAARQWWNKAASARGDFEQMAVKSVSIMTYFAIRALQALGRHNQAKRMIAQLESHARQLLKTQPTVDYFATSLPNMLLFSDNLAARRSAYANVLLAQAAIARGRIAEGLIRLNRALTIDPSYAPALMLKAQASVFRPSFNNSSRRPRYRRREDTHA